MDSFIKQIYGLIDTILVYITHIDNFIQNIDIIPMSSLVKRKDEIMNMRIEVQNDISDNISKHFSGLVELIEILKDDDNTYDDYTDVLKCFSEHSKNIDSINQHTILEAAYDGNLHLIKYLLHMDVVVDRGVLLWLASLKGHLYVVDYLINNGADIHAHEDKAIYWASRRGHMEVVEYLIKYDADPYRVMIRRL